LIKTSAESAEPRKADRNARIAVAKTNGVGLGLAPGTDPARFLLMIRTGIPTRVAATRDVAFSTAGRRGGRIGYRRDRLSEFANSA
jgi:hypothetical protein